MPVRKLRVSFVVDVDLFAKLLASSHEQLDIAVFGDEPSVTHTQGERHKALPTPTKGVNMIVLKAIAQGEIIAGMRAALEKAGYSPNSLDCALSKLRHVDKLITRVSQGTYKLTRKGQDHVNS
jgi:hypothetical protein